MEKLITVSITVIITCCAYEIRAFILRYKTKKMLKKTVENCLNILKERDE